MLQNTQMETLQAIERNLRTLQKNSKRERDTKHFSNYLSHYKSYEDLYSKACSIIDDEEMKDFELEIPQLSGKEIEVLARQGKQEAVLGSYLLCISDYSERLASYIVKFVAFQENILAAKTYLEDASHEKNRARILMEKRDWNGSVEASQHCIEHVIKSLFRLVGEPHPFKHDPTNEFKKVIEKLKTLPKWKLEQLARVRWIAKVWATVHKESMYAFYNIPAKAFFGEKDAKVLKDYAEEVYFTCQRLITSVEFREFKIQE